MSIQNDKKGMYTSLPEYSFYINKTEPLEKGIAVFPSIYIEGNAVLGKTVAVKMMLANHPEVSFVVLDMAQDFGNLLTLKQKLEEIQIQMQNECVWTVFENINKVLSTEVAQCIVSFCENLSQQSRVILVGRERIHEKFLPLLWKRKLELFSQEILLLTKEDIGKMVEKANCMLSAAEIYEESGGWAGCVDLMIRLSVAEQDKYGREKRNLRKAKELRQCYEIDTYIQKEIIGTLSEKEQELIYWGQKCPWLTKELCLEVWQEKEMLSGLERLERKGMFVYNRQKDRWNLVSLFQRQDFERNQTETRQELDSIWTNDKQNFAREQIETRQNFDRKQIENRQKFVVELQVNRWKCLGEWYKKKEYNREALFCFKQSGDMEVVRTFMIAHYERIPFWGISYDEVQTWKEQIPELCYLQGMHCYMHQNFEGVHFQLQRLEQMKEKIEENEKLKKNREILLNLYFITPNMSLDAWLELLETYANEVGKLKLYHVLGYSHTFLCGLRDLSGLFACSKKEERRKARIWKECLEEESWNYYQMARIDYYIETERQNKLELEDVELLNMDMVEQKESWQMRLGQLYQLCKLQNGKTQIGRLEQMKALEKSLLAEEHVVCIRNTEAITSLYGPSIGESERFVRWLRQSMLETKVEVCEETYVKLCCQAKGYILLNQLDKAERILRQVIPYVQKYHRFRFFAELLFQQGIVIWQKDSHSQALKSLVESFLVNGKSHYVGFYTIYGKIGAEVLNGYMEWLKNSEPEKWKRKKKYNYGNVVRMPIEDYIEVVLRCAEKNSDKFIKISDGTASERLTLMEISVLRSIQQGKSNAEICQELNLKLSTVKSHIYNLYKKLEVSSRMQAVKKGKELGIIE